MTSPATHHPGSTFATVTGGVLYGVGVGPGDPELMTLKAARVVSQCSVISFIVNASGNAMARKIATTVLDERARRDSNATFIELPVRLTMKRDRTLINAAYDTTARQMAQYLDDGQSIAFLCEGDPLFFGSFAYLAQRLCEHYPIEIVPGVSSIMAGTALSQRPVGLNTENLAVISGRHTDEKIAATLTSFDNVAIMKVGTQRAQIKRLIKQTGRTQDACYVEYIGLDNQRVVHDITTLDDEPGPYFSVFLVSHSREHEISDFAAIPVCHDD